MRDFLFIYFIYKPQILNGIHLPIYYNDFHPLSSL